MAQLLEESHSSDFGIIITGGAYKRYRHVTSKRDEYINTIKEAAKAGYRILKNGGTAVEAVEKSVSILEDCELFKAGRGSELTDKGEVECDAMIMDGHNLETGAVISGRHFKNPICLSRKIMEESPHCAFSGDGALDYAKSIGFPYCDPKELITKEQIEEWELHYDEEHFTDSDTACAVAIDKNDNLACALSTGGIGGKLKGRVGDAALVGCGGYANKKGAAVTFGRGEKLIKLTLARQVVFEMENGKSAQEATDKAIMLLKDEQDGLGGAIAIDKNGNFGKAFSTNLKAWVGIQDKRLMGEFDKNDDEGNVNLKFNERI
ncbi:isoaspartyl peptidase/L-asparaginase-like [Xenia sp. Carnegie-2017]|uniref:isoaspartyl peptidase/L-asparaginase-like n=1 Tax=Xenia sp. Carnegie-2017 TaxID=2897299 RepID=UPI001F04FFD5|nr:isoaspartyl peptidase/L-asparaginase-like [Xenia sp. Carnegie-2017]